jgi:hypothetical protein
MQPRPPQEEAIRLQVWKVQGVLVQTVLGYFVM